MKWNGNIVGKIQVPLNKRCTMDGLVPSDTPVALNGGLPNYQARANYATEMPFFWQVPAGLIARIDVLVVRIEDSGTIDMDSYGNGIALTAPNGIGIHVDDNTGTSINDLMQGLKIRRNADWDDFADAVPKAYGAGNQIFTARIRIDNEIRLVDQQRVAFKLLGNFSGLTFHQFIIGGYYENVWH